MLPASTNVAVRNDVNKVALVGRSWDMSSSSVLMATTGELHDKTIINYQKKASGTVFTHHSRTT